MKKEVPRTFKKGYAAPFFIFLSNFLFMEGRFDFI